jgi:fermentation-respiration switch protein FrsA (DUF1100 family)
MHRTCFPAGQAQLVEYLRVGSCQLVGIWYRAAEAVEQAPEDGRRRDHRDPLQWSVDDTNARADRNIAGVHVPLLAIENSADDAVPQSHVSRVYQASPATVKDYMLIKGANHYYSDQPQQLQEAVNGTVDWLVRHGLAW